MMRVGRVAGTLAVALSLCGTLAQAQTARARQGLLSLEDARLFYEVVGSGEPIIIVHGGPGLDHRYLRPGLDILAARHQLIYYDQRGTGRSDAALDSSAINLDAFVEDIDALREGLGFERVTVLTHSFGSLFGLEYARRHPEHLRALILMNPVEPGTRFRDETATRQRAARTEEDSTELAELMSSEAFAAHDPATIGEIYRVAFRGTFRDRARVDEVNLDIARRTAENGQEVGRLLGQSLGSVDWWDRLPEIDVPTLVLAGRYDVPPVAMGRAMAEALPRGTFVRLDSGHFPYVEDPAGLTSAVSAFFAGLGR
jgi:proline iminopeptidase